MKQKVARVQMPEISPQYLEIHWKMLDPFLRLVIVSPQPSTYRTNWSYENQSPSGGKGRSYQTDRKGYFVKFLPRLKYRIMFEKNNIADGKAPAKENLVIAEEKSICSRYIL